MTYTRTTITLPENLLIEVKRRALEDRKTIKEIVHESIKEYLEQGKDNEKLKLRLLAKSFVGAGKFSKKHPSWKSKQSVQAWLRKLRAQWD